LVFYQALFKYGLYRYFQNTMGPLIVFLVQNIFFFLNFRKGRTKIKYQESCQCPEEIRQLVAKEESAFLNFLKIVLDD